MALFEITVFFFLTHQINAASCAIIMMVFNTCFLVVISSSRFFHQQIGFHCTIFCSTSYYQSNGRLHRVFFFHFGKELTIDVGIHWKHPVVPLNLVVNRKLSLSGKTIRLWSNTSSYSFFYSFNYYISSECESFTKIQWYDALLFWWYLMV